MNKKYKKVFVIFIVVLSILMIGVPQIIYRFVDSCDKYCYLKTFKQIVTTIEFILPFAIIVIDLLMLLSKKIKIISFFKECF